jgi:C4-dicarboxylate transporter DctQ subunit
LLEKIRDSLAHLEEWVIGALLVAMTLITFGQVVARYVFNYSFVWAVELTTMLFAAMIFLGAAYGVRTGSHIGVDVLIRALGPKAARVVGAIAVLACLVYSVILFIGSWTYVSKMYEIGILAQDLPIPQWVPKVVMPFGLALMIWRFAGILHRIVRGERRSLGLADEAEDVLRQLQVGRVPGADEGAVAAAAGLPAAHGRGAVGSAPVPPPRRDGNRQ